MLSGICSISAIRHIFYKGQYFIRKVDVGEGRTDFSYTPELNIPSLMSGRYWSVVICGLHCALELPVLSCNCYAVKHQWMHNTSNSAMRVNVS